MVPKGQESLERAQEQWLGPVRLWRLVRLWQQAQSWRQQSVLVLQLVQLRVVPKGQESQERVLEQEQL